MGQPSYNSPCIGWEQAKMSYRLWLAWRGSIRRNIDQNRSVILMRSSMLKLWRDGRIRSKLRGTPLCLMERMTLATRLDQRAQAYFATGILPVTSAPWPTRTPPDRGSPCAVSDGECPALFPKSACNCLHQTSWTNCRS